jgi:hypothetical protein
VWRIAQRYDGIGIREALVVYVLHDGQMHDDVDALERDLRVLLDPERPDPFGRGPRGAFDAYLFFRKAAGGHLRAAAAHLPGAVRQDPAALVRVPASALWRRGCRRVLRRWPARAVSDPTVVD